MASWDALPGRIGGKYRPLRVLGRGGMSVVYEVEHEVTLDRLALKLMHASAEGISADGLTRFRREARVWSLLKSPHVVRVIDADIDRVLGAAYLVMDLLEGRSLAAVAGAEPRPPSRVVGWLRQIAPVL